MGNTASNPTRPATATAATAPASSSAAAASLAAVHRSGRASSSVSSGPTSPIVLEQDHYQPQPRAPPSIPVPAPGSTQQQGRPLKTKKKSLELPDLASLALTPAIPPPTRPIHHPRSPQPRASSPIPIPNSAVRPIVDRALSDSPTMSHTLAPTEPVPLQHPINHAPAPDAGPSNGAIPRQTSSTSLLTSRRPSRGQVVHPASGTKKKKNKIIGLTASIPTGLPEPNAPSTSSALGALTEHSEAEQVELVTVHIKWREGGHLVQVAATWDNPPWSARKAMTWDQETGYHRMTVRIPPGSHRLKFIQDDIWRCSSHMPTATDDAGNLVNYIEVRSKRKNSETANTKEWGSSWWGDGSSDSEDEEAGAWISTIPPRLFKAAAEEETYLQLTSSNNSDFNVPNPPAIPSPPALPRHLEKLILNARVNPPSRHHGTPPASSARPSRRRRGLDGDLNGDDTSVLPVPSHAVINHLGTSAIRNGVLAVGTTTRYKAKYISTVYYYPT